MSLKISVGQNLLQIGSDDPNGNISFLQKYNDKRSFSELANLLPTSTCDMDTYSIGFKAREIVRDVSKRQQ